VQIVILCKNCVNLQSMEIYSSLVFECLRRTKVAKGLKFVEFLINYFRAELHRWMQDKLSSRERGKSLFLYQLVLLLYIFLYRNNKEIYSFPRIPEFLNFLFCSQYFYLIFTFSFKQFILYILKTIRNNFDV